MSDSAKDRQSTKFGMAVSALDEIADLAEELSITIAAARAALAADKEANGGTSHD